MLYISWHWCFAFQYTLLAILFQKIPSGFQWILVIILPLQRELNIYVVYKLYKKFSHADDLVMKSFLNIHINAGHSLFLYYLNLLINFGWDLTMEFDWIWNNTAYRVDYMAEYGNDTNNYFNN